MSDYCDHIPDGEVYGHIELWKTENGWTAIAFGRPEMMPQVIASSDPEQGGCSVPGPMLQVAADHLAEVAQELAEEIA